MPFSLIDMEALAELVSGLTGAFADTGIAGDGTTVDYLEDPAKSWAANALVGLTVEITGGSGGGQTPRKIASNTATRVYVATPWEIAPDSSSTYRIGLSGLIQSIPSEESYRVTEIARRKSDGAIVIKYEV